MTAAITFDSVSKTYGRGRTARPALKNVSFEVQEGEIVGFLGPNGAGKTTAMHVLLNFLFPSSGQTRIFGIDAADPRSRRDVGFLPEIFNFDGFLTGRRFLQLFDRLNGRRRQDLAEYIPEVLEYLDMPDAAEVRIKKYSKGMTQKIGLAQALGGDPRLLILDEPTSGMDPVAKAKIKQLFGRLRSEGKTIFLSSHILADVEDIADRVAIINEGTLLAVDRVSELKLNSSREETRVVISGAGESLLGELAQHARIEKSGEQVVIRCADNPAKDAVLRLVLDKGGNIVSVKPTGTSLTDHFLRLVQHEELTDD